MCGLAGIWDLQGTLRAGEADALVRTMTDSLHHRGPDGEGFWSDADRGVVLGHRRLSIVDLSEAGHQPMCSRDGRWVISYNGEIYDHKVVRKDLEAAGTAFRGHSDTEVLVEAIAAWGIGPVLRRVDGMFAIALWDRHEQELHLIRDRFGEKPMSYGTIDGSFVFASDTRSFRAAFPGRLELDPQAINAFLRFRAIPAPLSIHKGISKLKPATWLTVGADGSTSEQTWFDSWVEAASRLADSVDCSEEELVDLVESTLMASVANRLEADVPVGVFLSGGIDSSLITALAKSASSQPVRTFTIGFTEPGFDESRFAKPIAEHLGTDHTELVLSPQEAMASIGRAIAAYDEPFSDSSQIPTLLVSELARKHVTVALGGDGGDEFFGGYNRHRWIPSAWSQMDRLPTWARRLAGRTVAGVPSGLAERATNLLPVDRRPRQIALKLEKMAGTLTAESPETLWLQLVSHWQFPEVLTSVVELNPLANLDFSGLPLADAVAIADISHYLPTDILTKVDRASMASSLEVRAPFLGRDVTDLAWRIPMEQRMADGVPKALLRDVLGRHVPRVLWDRPKSGFGIPLGQWLTGPLRPWAQEQIAEVPLLFPTFDADEIAQVWKDTLKDPSGLAAFLVWDLISLSTWAGSQ